MTMPIAEDIIQSLRNDLNQHPVYAAIQGLDELRVFMEHHVYSVWDFMSVVKHLQAVVAPDGFPWVPLGDGDVRRFINEMVLGEECDEAMPGSGAGYTSHFELYCQAMEEIGADSGPMLAFVDTVRQQGVDAALALSSVPSPSRDFTTTTFRFLTSGKPHEAAAALALGREHIIPDMFRAILERSGIGRQDAPIFHYYLERHIHLDEGSHGPLSLRLLNGLCRSEDERREAIAAARAAVQARLNLWDGVLAALEGGGARMRQA
ncbi:MAG: heme oxygenase [Gammaproteobacteria bacterium]|nr:heme oxygenase [Gammaproteobacteria bacterium]